MSRGGEVSECGGDFVRLEPMPDDRAGAGGDVVQGAEVCGEVDPTLARRHDAMVGVEILGVSERDASLETSAGRAEKSPTGP